MDAKNEVLGVKDQVLQFHAIYSRLDRILPLLHLHNQCSQRAVNDEKRTCDGLYWRQYRSGNLHICVGFPWRI